MRAALPPYTQVLNGNPIDFSDAKKALNHITYRKECVQVKNDTALTAKGICFAYKRCSAKNHFALIHNRNFVCGFQNAVHSVAADNNSYSLLTVELRNYIYKVLCRYGIKLRNRLIKNKQIRFGSKHRSKRNNLLCAA